MQGLLTVTSATPVRGLFFLERQLGLSAEVPARRMLEAAFTSLSTNCLDLSSGCQGDLPKCTKYPASYMPFLKSMASLCWSNLTTSPRDALFVMVKCMVAMGKMLKQWGLLEADQNKSSAPFSTKPLLETHSKVSNLMLSAHTHISASWSLYSLWGWMMMLDR